MQTYTTQMDAARKGIITPQMEIVAKKEYRTIEEIRAKFKPGMVLVVPSTSNEMLSYVRDAAALVVEEPGLNSHAAIAGKALLKPTVVGAAGATSHIRDGLMVAVDCAHGSVQRLQG